MDSIARAKRVVRVVNQIENLEGVLATLLGKGENGSEGPSEARILQGRYMGLTNRLPTRVMSHIRQIRKEQGIKAAIKAAEEIRQKELDQ